MKNQSEHGYFSNIQPVRRLRSGRMRFSTQVPTNKFQFCDDLTSIVKATPI